MLAKQIARGTWNVLLLLALLLWCAAESKPPGCGECVSQDARAGQDKSSEKGQRASQDSVQNDPAADPSRYVGTDTCKSCHEDEFKSYKDGPHWKTTLDKRKGPQWQGCEACHGPGKEHAESADPSMIIRFPALSREESSQRCLSCHDFGEGRAGFLGSQHLKNNVGCVDCHSVHSPKVNEKLLTAAQPALCYKCHLEVKPGSSRLAHHGVTEGLNECTKCHNPHGGFTKHHLSDTATQDHVRFYHENPIPANAASRLPRGVLTISLRYSM